MTPDADEPRPPRRAKPPARPPANPRLPGSPAENEPAPDAASTWRPATKKTAASGRSDRIPNEPRVVEGGPGWLERILLGRVSSGHLATFCRQFSQYLAAGVDLIKSLDNLEKQFARTALGPVIGRLSLGVRRGEALADAVAREPAAFDTLFLSMMKVAEARGGVPETLRTLSDHYEARQRLFRQARSAMIYPAAVIIIAMAVGALLTIFVLPALVSILEDTARGKNIELPGPTRVLIAISSFMQRLGWWAVPLAVVGGVFGLSWIYKKPRGKAIIDEICLYVPVLGLLLQKIDTARLSRTLSALLQAGVDLGQSLDLTADVLHLVPFRKALRSTREAVMEGTELSVALDATKRFRPDVIAIVNSGEETGQIPETLSKLADEYEEQVTFMVKNLGSLIQPVIIIILGGIVGFIVLAFIMAYVQILAGLSGG